MDNILFIGGIAAGGCAVVAAAVILIIHIRNTRRLKQRLDEEYGRTPALKAEGEQYAADDSFDI